MLPKETPLPVPVTPFTSQPRPAALMKLAPAARSRFSGFAVPIAVFAATLVAHDQLLRILERRRRAP